MDQRQEALIRSLMAMQQPPAGGHMAVPGGLGTLGMAQPSMLTSMPPQMRGMQIPNAYPGMGQGMALPNAQPGMGQGMPIPNYMGQ